MTWEVFKPPTRYQRMRELADRRGYITLLETPLGRVKLRALHTGRFRSRPTPRAVRNQRVARTRMKYALAWINRQHERREVAEVLDQLAAEGQIAKLGPDRYLSYPPGDTGYPETKLKRARIWEMWDRGATMDEIAGALNTTRATVGNEMARMRRFGWDLPRRNNWSEDALERQRHVWRLRGLPKPPPRPRRPSTSRGFCRLSNGRPGWRAYGYSDGRQVHLGIHETEQDAAAAVCAWRAESA